MEEGFAVNHRKTRVMRPGIRQHLAGIVVNQQLNVRRADYDRLKKTLTNCVRSGAQSQNRAGHQDFFAHLLGKISFVEMLNSERATIGCANCSTKSNGSRFGTSQAEMDLQLCKFSGFPWLPGTITIEL